MDGNENVKLLAKQQLCTCTTLFYTFLSPFLHDYDVNMHFVGELILVKKALF